MSDEQGRQGRQDDEELIRLMTAYQAGELAAFERLYALLAGELGRYFSAAAEKRVAAPDLVQDTFLEIHRSRRTYQPPLPVRPWVFGIARNVLGRHRREAWRRGRLEASGEPPEGAAPLPEARQELGDLTAALACLPASRREAWVLHHVHGWSFQQIAARCRIGVGAAKLRSSRAMRVLRAALGAAPETEIKDAKDG
jgi:RNA polymerase sigma factor (sigma-70 family)